MQTERAIRVSPVVRNKLMLACAIVVACVLATPAALAHDHRYPGHRDNSGKVLGALVVGAVIGGVLASSSHQGGYYYPAQAYPPPPAYQGGYPAYGYGGYAYPAYGYGGGVSVGVVYSNHGYRYDNRARRYYYRDRGHQGYYRHYDNRRGWQGHDSHRRGH